MGTGKSFDKLRATVRSQKSRKAVFLEETPQHFLHTIGGIVQIVEEDAEPNRG